MGEASEDYIQPKRGFPLPALPRFGGGDPFLRSGSLARIGPDVGIGDADREIDRVAVAAEGGRNRSRWRRCCRAGRSSCSCSIHSRQRPARASRAAADSFRSATARPRNCTRRDTGWYSRTHWPPAPACRPGDSGCASVRARSPRSPDTAAAAGFRRDRPMYASAATRRRTCRANSDEIPRPAGR